MDNNREEKLSELKALELQMEKWKVVQLESSLEEKIKMLNEIIKNLDHADLMKILMPKLKGENGEIIIRK